MAKKGEWRIVLSGREKEKAPLVSQRKETMSFDQSPEQSICFRSFWSGCYHGRKEIESCFEWMRKNKKPAEDTAGSKKIELRKDPLVFWSGWLKDVTDSSAFPQFSLDEKKKFYM